MAGLQKTRPAAARGGGVEARPGVARTGKRRRNSLRPRAINCLVKSVPQKKRSEPVEELLATIDRRKDLEAATAARATELRKQIDELLAALPKPAGARRTGRSRTRPRTFSSAPSAPPPQFNFSPLAHEAIGEKLGMMDFAGAAKTVGGRAFVVLKRRTGAAGTRAPRPVLCSICTPTSSVTPKFAPPYLVREETAYGTGNLPKAAEDMFQTTNGMWLIPTAEMPLTNLVSGEILDEASLPIRMTAWTPSFRSEAGAAGRDNARDDPRPPVQQGRAGVDRQARGLRRRA